MLRNKLGLLATVVLLVLVVAAVVADWLPLEAYKQNLRQSLKPPSARNPFGTDPLGRDVLARVLLATRASLVVGGTTVTIATSLGTFLGLVAGYTGGLVDAVVMNVCNGLMSVPFVVLVIALVAAVGPSMLNVVLVLGLTGWVPHAKLVRGEIVRLRSAEYVEAARALGASSWRIVFLHMLPHVWGIISVTSSLLFGQMIISEATLSFLGLGIPPPSPTLGGILSAAQTYFFFAWWLAVFPGLVLATLVLATNVLGDALAHHLDPRERGSGRGNNR